MNSQYNKGAEGETNESKDRGKEEQGGRRMYDKLETCDDDPRFQQTNKTAWCYRMFVDYHRCRNLLGDNATQCGYFYKCFHSICPNEWHERWTDQLAAGTFPCDVSRERQIKQDHY